MSKKKREAPAPAEAVREDYDPTEWGNIELPGLSDEELHSKNWAVVTGNKTKAKDPKWLASIRKANAKKAQDPVWRAKVIQANTNWTDERREAYNNRDKSYLDRDGEWYKKQVKNNKKSRIPVQVKKPGEDWVEYKSVRDFAATTDDANMFEGNPRYYFPKDMSVKTIKRSDSAYKGWQFQRLKEKQW